MLTLDGVAFVVTQMVLHCSTCEIRWIADSAWLLREKARSHAPFVMVGWSYSSTLGCRGKRLDVPELSQERVLVVVAAPGHDPSLFVELTNLAERQGYPATGRRH